MEGQSRPLKDSKESTDLDKSFIEVLADTTKKEKLLEGIIRLVRMVQKIVIRTVYVLPIQMVSHM